MHAFIQINSLVQREYDSMNEWINVIHVDEGNLMGTYVLRHKVLVMFFFMFQVNSCIFVIYVQCGPCCGLRQILCPGCGLRHGESGDDHVIPLFMGTEVPGSLYCVYSLVYTIGPL